MPAPVTEDDNDFATSAEPQNKLGRAAGTTQTPPKKEPPTKSVETETTADADGLPAKSRFHPRLVTKAEEYGLSPEEIEACADSSELRWLIDQERASEHERRQSQGVQAGRGGRGAGADRDGNPAAGTAASPPPPPPPAPAKVVAPPEDEWDFEDAAVADILDPRVAAEIKRLGKALLKAAKGGNDERVGKLEKQLEGAVAELTAIRSANSPAVREANAAVAKYPTLFGAEFDDDGRPPAGTPESVRHETLVAYINSQIAAGKAGKSPGKDIAAAVAVLFPGHSAANSAGGASPPPPPPPAPPAKKQTANGSRIEEWNKAGQAAPTGRNGAEKTGQPSDEDARKAIARGLKKQGLPTDAPAAADDDTDDF